jgi:hypothetical protein
MEIIGMSCAVTQPAKGLTCLSELVQLHDDQQSYDSQ